MSACDPWGFLASQPTLLCEFQANMRSCLKNRVDRLGEIVQWITLLPQVCENAEPLQI